MPSKSPSQARLMAAAQTSHKKFWPNGPFVSVDIAQFGLESDWGHRVGRAVASRRSLIFVRT